VTIPGDTLNRWWVEASGENQELVDDLRPALIAFVSFSPDGDAKIVGTGFIIAGDPKAALVVTAKHVLLEGAFRIQYPHPKFDPTSHFIPEKLTRPSIEPKDMKIVWMDSNNGLMMDVWHLNYNDTSDIACCVVTYQESDEGLFKPTSLPIDTTVPSVDDLIYMVSLDNLTNSTEHVDKESRRMKLSRRMSIRCGVVTGIHPKGFRQYRWPCFTTSIPAAPGMSGGLVALPKEGKTFAACGIVCADNSPEEARSDYSICGESVIASAWSMLGMKLPECYPPDSTTPHRSLYENMVLGNIPMAVGGIDLIDIIELEGGNYKIRRK